MRVKQLKFLIEIERERWALMAAVKLLLRERERELANTTVIVADTKAARVGEWTEEERESGRGGARAAHCTLLLLSTFVLLRRVIVLRCDHIIIKSQDFFGKLP